MRRLPWLVFALTAAALFTHLVLYSQPAADDPSQPPLAAIVALGVFTLVAAFVGAVVASRRPRNLMGWLFLAYPLGYATVIAASLYARQGLPGASGAYALSQLALIAWFGGAPLSLLLFPNGRLPSRRWRWIAWIPVAEAVQIAVPPEFFAARGVAEVRSTVAFLGFIASLAIAIAAMIVRFRRSHGVEREQLKWVFYASGLVATAAVLELGIGILHAFHVLDEVRDQWLANYGFLLVLASLSLVPICAGLAVLRYRLYDIDLLVNRTVVYGATTTAIGAAFFAAIVTLQALLRPLTAGSDLAVAASTLLSFALFQPVRRRAQDAVDRRFDRSHYDAARTVELFTDRLRDEVDLDALRADLIGVVQQTIAPAHVSLWLRGRSG